MTTKKWVLGGVAVLVVAIAGLAAFAWSGIYNVGADDQHTRPVHVFLETMRKRSIEVRAQRLQPPFDLTGAERIRQGSGNYDAMCIACHLAPGMGETELSLGLNPSPPNLSKESVDATGAFWAIKHGIKASGMPAWGGSMDDEYIWNMVAFLQEMPNMDATQYRTLVASSDGHDHGGGETDGHGHGDGGAHDQHETSAEEHGHEHAEPTTSPADSAEPESHDAHDHQH